MYLPDSMFLSTESVNPGRMTAQINGQIVEATQGPSVTSARTIYANPPVTATNTDPAVASARTAYTKPPVISINTDPAVTIVPTRPPVLIDMPEKWFKTEGKPIAEIPTRPPVLVTEVKPVTVVETTKPYEKVNENAGLVNPSNLFTTKSDPVKKAETSSKEDTSGSRAKPSQGDVRDVTASNARTTAKAVQTTENVKAPVGRWSSGKKALVLIAVVVAVWAIFKYVKFK